MIKKREAKGELFAVATDGFDRATCQSFFSQSALIVAFRLLENERMTTVVITLEVRWSCFAAEIAVDALIVHVVGTGDVLRIFVCSVGHV